MALGQETKVIAVSLNHCYCVWQDSIEGMGTDVELAIITARRESRSRNNFCFLHN